MASSPEEKKVLEETNSDDDVLAQLGYTQGKFHRIMASNVY
jgi:choline transport protein